MQLSEAQRAFLEEVHFAVVATIGADGLPHQTVMWYMVDGDELLLNTPFDSLKHRHLKRDNRLSVCVESGYRYITLSGTVTMNEDAATARAEYQRLGQRYAGTFAMRTEQSAGMTMSKQMQDMLSRERVALHLKIAKVQANGVG